MMAPKYLYVGPAEQKEFVERVLIKKHGVRVQVRHIRNADDLCGIGPSQIEAIAIHPSTYQVYRVTYHEINRADSIMSVLRDRFKHLPRVDPWREHENAVAEQIRKETYDQGYAAGYAAALRKEGGAG